MRYGIVDPYEWATNEAWGSATFCIALLDNAGNLAQNELTDDVAMGDGAVYEIVDGHASKVGSFPLPMDVRIFGSYLYEQDAIDYYMQQYTNPTVEVERGVNAELTLNMMIDDYVDEDLERQRSERYMWLILACLAVIVLVVLLSIIFVKLGYR